MNIIAKIAITLLVLILVAAGAAFISTKITDGPTAILAGGPFTTGTLIETEPEWSFVKDYTTVEFQLLDPAQSRTTWIMEHNNRIFIPSGYMNSTIGKLWKHWPLQAEQDGRAILRVDGKLYNRQLVRLHDDPDMPAVLSEVGRKYFGGEPVPPEMVTSGSLWIFELKPRV